MPSYTTPPPAGAQPSPCTASADNLDALDGRFQQASFQFSNSVWNVHTETLGSFPTPRFYQVAGAAGTLIQSGQFFKSNSSFDFNPSIFGVNSTAFVTWTATDPANALNASVMYGSRNQTDASGVMNINATPAFTSPVCITGDFDPNFGLQRWGDYSSVSLDPTTGLFWILNEDIGTASAWGTRGVRIGM